MLYTDRCFKSYGVKFSFISIVYEFIFIFSAYCSLVVVFERSGSDMMAGVVSFLISIFVCLHVLLSSFIESKVIKFIEFNNTDALITKYIGKKEQLKTSEIDGVKDIKRSFIMRFMRLFEGDSNGLQIHCNNKNYLITPHMERFDELKAKIEAIVEHNQNTHEH